MDDSQKIERIIEVMQQLQSMCKDLNDPVNNRKLIIGLMIAMIVSTQVPDVTILPNNREIAFA